LSFDVFAPKESCNTTSISAHHHDLTFSLKNVVFAEVVESFLDVLRPPEVKLLFLVNHRITVS
jgi:hypothetical protein